MAIWSLQTQLLLLVIMGIAMEKRGCVGAAGRRTLSDLLIFVIIPCNILYSCASLEVIPPEFSRTCLLLFLFSLLIQVTGFFMGKLLFRKQPEKVRSVLRYGLLCSNSGFIGLPVVQALFGGLGVMYASVYIIPLRLAMWTVGFSLFSPITSKDALKKVVTNPCILCTLVGLLLPLSPIQIPEFLSSTLLAVSRCVIPISMFFVGSILACVPMRALISKTVLMFTFLRLILFPGLVFLVLLPLRLDNTLVGICVLMTGMPAASLASVLATKYGGSTEVASHVIFTSTLFSMITIPLWVMAINHCF